MKITKLQQELKMENNKTAGLEQTTNEQQNVITKLQQFVERQNNDTMKLQRELLSQQQKNYVLESTMNQLVRVSSELQRNVSTAQDDIAHIGLAVTEVQSNHNRSSEVLYDKISQVEERLNQSSAANSVVFNDLVSTYKYSRQ